MSNQYDNLYSELVPKKGSFSFNKDVVNVFENMVNRSVPFYQELQQLIVSLVHDFSKQGDHIYDLGCSLGYTISSCFQSFNHQYRYITGLDASKDMIQAASTRLDSYKDHLSLEIHDLSQPYNYKLSSVVILNLTLQFLPISNRSVLLEEIYQCLKPGGILILVEKINHQQGDIFKFMNKHYHQFKQNNGYSSQQVNNKAIALEGVLSSLTKEQNQKMLHQAGFSDYFSFFQYLQFWGCVAIKS